jgi:uncharacterized membrane protein YbhN (UPF0104 family)
MKYLKNKNIVLLFGSIICALFAYRWYVVEKTTFEPTVSLATAIFTVVGYLYLAFSKSEEIKSGKNVKIKSGRNAFVLDESSNGKKPGSTTSYEVNSGNDTVFIDKSKNH